MRRATFLTTLALLALPLSAPPAHADEPVGFLCSFASITDPQVEGSQTGEMDGGPLVVTGDDGLPASAHLFCTIQVNSSTHAGADALSCVFEGVGVVAGACVGSYASAPGDNVYLCTEIWIYWQGHKTLYWNDSDDPLVDGHWSTSSNASCGLATSVQG